MVVPVADANEAKVLRRVLPRAQVLRERNTSGPCSLAHATAPKRALVRAPSQGRVRAFRVKLSLDDRKQLRDGTQMRSLDARRVVEPGESQALRARAQRHKACEGARTTELGRDYAA